MPSLLSSVLSARRRDDAAWVAVMGLVGYAVLGFMHFLIGWIALQVAWGGGGEEASASGALALLARQPLGTVLLWIVAIGLVLLALWQLIEAIRGDRRQDGLKGVATRVGSAGKAIAYAVLGVSAGRFAVGGGSSSQSSEESLTAKALSAPAGQVLVAAVGLGIAALGGFLVYKGVSRRFLDDLDAGAASGRVGTAMEGIGLAGHVAKGVAYGIVGVLVVYAAITHDPEKSGGLDDALRTLREQPFGQWLLTLVALGLVAYGIYCWGRSWSLHDDAS